MDRRVAAQIMAPVLTEGEISNGKCQNSRRARLALQHNLGIGGAYVVTLYECAPA